MEWETALVFRTIPTDRKETWKDREVLIIAGDRRQELNDMPLEQLKPWYYANIEGNRNSMESLIKALKAFTACL
jgi:hypothetical protein